MSRLFCAHFQRLCSLPLWEGQWLRSIDPSYQKVNQLLATWPVTELFLHWVYIQDTVEESKKASSLWTFNHGFIFFHKSTTKDIRKSIFGLRIESSLDFAFTIHLSEDNYSPEKSWNKITGHEIRFLKELCFLLFRGSHDFILCLWSESLFYAYEFCCLNHAMHISLK